MHLVSDSFLFQTLDKKLMSDLRVSYVLFENSGFARFETRALDYLKKSRLRPFHH